MRTIVLTGVTSGLGLAALQQLARDSQLRLICGVRGGPSRLDHLLHDAKAQVESYDLDLASLASVRDFAASFSGPVHALMANAGVQTSAETLRSQDGHELTFAVNHLAHALLWHLLQPRFPPGARIVFTASGTHDPADAGARRFGFRGGLYQPAARLAAGDVAPGTSPAQAGRDRYATSKLCNILTAYEAGRRFPGYRVAAFDPGLMPGTGLARNHGSFRFWVWKNILPAVSGSWSGVSTPDRSGATLAWWLTDPNAHFPDPAHFDFRRQATATSADSQRLDWAAQLWDDTLAILAPFLDQPAIAPRAPSASPGR